MCSTFVNGQTDYEHHVYGESHVTIVQEWKLEDKKRRVIEAGADPSAVKICYLCNAVLSRQAIYEIHINGRKHKTKVKKSS